jgi:hypothetical protein
MRNQRKGFSGSDENGLKQCDLIAQPNRPIRGPARTFASAVRVSGQHVESWCKRIHQ